MKFLVKLEIPSWFLCFKGYRPVGIEIIEAESIGAAYEKVQKDITIASEWRIYSIQHVDDDTKPNELKSMDQTEMIFRHKENMAKYRSRTKEK
jgi:hypothetical protein